MSMTYDALPIDHPTWCVAPFCESPHPHDYRHTSVPVLMDAAPFDDCEITLSRTRDDEFVPSTTEWLQREEGVLLRLFNTASVTKSGADITAEVLMPRATVHRLIRELQALDAQLWGDDTEDGAR